MASATNWVRRAVKPPPQNKNLAHFVIEFLLLATQAGHGDFAEYHRPLGHADAEVWCCCGREKKPEYFCFWRLGRTAAKRPLGLLSLQTFWLQQRGPLLLVSCSRTQVSSGRYARPLVRPWATDGRIPVTQVFYFLASVPFSPSPFLSFLSFLFSCTTWANHMYGRNARQLCSAHRLIQALIARG